MPNPRYASGLRHRRLVAGEIFSASKRAAHAGRQAHAFPPSVRRSIPEPEPPIGLGPPQGLLPKCRRLSARRVGQGRFLAFLLLFVGTGLCAGASLSHSASYWWTTVAGMLAVVAMGIQNTLSRTALADLGPTTIMTGNTTQIVIDLTDLPNATPERADAIRVRLRKMLPAVTGFAAGAVLGALAFAATSFWCVLLPALLLAALCLQRWQASLRASNP